MRSSFGTGLKWLPAVSLVLSLSGSLWSDILISADTNVTATRNDPVPPMPPQPPVLNCFAFPGTAEWNQCMADFQRQMAEFEQQIQAYAQSQGGGSSSVSSINVNGFRIHANGLSLSSSMINGQLHVYTPLGNSDKLQISKLASSIKFDVQNDQNTTQSLEIWPPSSVSLDTIHNEIKGQKLHIWTDTA